MALNPFVADPARRGLARSDPRARLTGRLDAAFVAPAFVGFVTFVVFVLTLMPGVAFGDWAEMQVVPHVAGIAHPTGYPTYLLLARLVDFVPLGSVAVRGNLLSAVLIALTCATVVVICRRLDVRAPIAIAAGLALGFVTHVWQAATVAEVNPLHLFLMALLIHRVMVWSEAPSARNAATGGLLVGLALGNHLLTLFVAPPLALYALWVGRRAIRTRPVLVLVTAVAALAGLGVYLYIPLAALAGPPLLYNDPTTLSRFLELTTGQQFRGQFDFLSPDGPAAFAASLPELWRVLVAAGTPVLPVIGGFGLVVLLRRRPAFALAAAAVLFAVFYFWGSYVRLEHYLLVPWLILAIGAGVAVEAVAGALERPVVVARLRPALAVAILALVCTAGLAARNWGAADRSHDESGQQFVAGAMGPLPANAAILSYWDTSTTLWYAQLAEGIRPDVLVVDDSDIVFGGWGSREARIKSLICERPVFILRLGEEDLIPTRLQYVLTPVARVPVARGGPSMDEYRPIYRVQPKSATACPGG